jgi:uncharacterized phage-associated protein
MINFFRKIRENMLTENNFSKYLLYAIGEIVLVMVGILLAVQVNNWNENVKNKSMETDYLIRISQDLDNDLAAFEKTIDLAQSRNKRILFLQQALNDSDLAIKSSDYFIKSIIQAGWTFEPSISDYTFDELKSSGRLVLIQNKDLRTSLSKYYNSRYSDRQWNYIRENVQTKYYEYSAGILNQEQTIWVVKNDYEINPDSIKISRDELDEVYKRFKSKQNFHQLLPQVFEVKFETIKKGESSKSEAQKLKDDIQKELDGVLIKK